MNINYPKIEEYNKENNFYNYIFYHIKQFKNRKNKIELGYLCAKEIIELTKRNKELYKNCVKCLKLVELWLKDENSINIQELKRIADSISISNSIYSISYSIYYSISNFVNSAYSIYCAYRTKPELLPYIQNLTQLYLREEKQFNTKNHNNTYYEKILKQIINTDYDKLYDIDKNQIIDIINEFYNIEINEFDFITHKTIQREFM